ncbi:hypothetical protein DYY67_0083 [Candidatus Nitrosotalea sp. TS]|uniref:endonuclease dU n=1 Tax=Candidatus Nitrosotalea sp. TS TaxID=2341020 RepID=UPI001407488D|nr:DUF99 family protein [Candidatus Nitrosotalea sp. TS]NHI02962.1 hypothetical protein [Candidatus Nitrosotalea sp. TS]
MNHLRLEKKGLRGLAIAESFRETDLKSKLAGVVMRRDFVIDGFVFGSATVEGDDATDVIISMYEKLDRDDISFILVSGLIISMYNIVDMKKLWKNTNMPIIGVTYEESDGIEDAIRHHFPNSCESKIKQYKNLGTRTKVSLHTKHDIYLRVEGCDMKEAKKLLDAFTLQGAIPEPLRVAQILAKAELDLKS